MSRRVDVHCHYLPPPYVEALGARAAPPRLARDGGKLLLDLGDGGMFPLQAEMTDLDLQTEAMAQADIDQAVLSIIPPAVDGLDAAEARALARASNDALAEAAAARDGHFLALATLPAVDPAGAADELQRSVGIGLRGGVLLTNVRGARLDAERFRPIFESAAELDVPIVLHPTAPAHPDPFVEFGLMTTVGFIMETTVCVLRLVLSGLYERHRNFKLVAPHVGAVIPYLFGRIQYEIERYGVGAEVLSEPVGDQLRRVYVDSVSVWPPAIRLALEVFGSDHVMFGTDVPFWERDKSVAAVEACGLDGDGLEKVYEANARTLFGDA